MSALQRSRKSWIPDWQTTSASLSSQFSVQDTIETLVKHIWKLIEVEQTVDTDLPIVVPRALSAWSFLLSSLDLRRLSDNHWKRVISVLLRLLNTSNEAVAIASSEALVLVCGFNCLEKFENRKMN